MINDIKVARYSFSGSIPAKFEHKLRRQKQSFGKTATTVVLPAPNQLYLETVWEVVVRYLYDLEAIFHSIRGIFNIFYE